MLVKKMSAKEARNSFSDLLGVVYYSKKTVIVEKRGKPVAVVISPEDYKRLLAGRDERLAVFDEVRVKNPKVTAQKAEEDAIREISARRKEKGADIGRS
jgi:prevent-host-death family protein